LKKKGLQSVKNIKKAFYKEKASSFKKWIIIMSAAGLAASLGYFAKYAYVEYAVSRAEIVLTYPEIAHSRYPDGSRFTYYEFISDENINRALKILQKNGKYKNFTVGDLRDKFYVYSYLDGSAGASVSSARSEGNDFSYVANEYKITFVQPHDYKAKKLSEMIFTPDYSGEFLDALIEVNRTRIGEESGGLFGFKKLTDPIDTSNYDYSEEIRIYKTRINTIISYLNYLDKKKPGFVSPETGMTVKDIEGKYSFLITNSLDGISNFIDSSGLSTDAELASNKLKVNIENNTLKFKKFTDRSVINRYAMENYDQTFTENLINVIQNEEYGLYQARPKTAFDTVATQKHSADESVAEYGTKIALFNDDLIRYGTAVQSPEEYERLSKKCESLLSEFEKEYAKLASDANVVIGEFYNNLNENYITSKITKKRLISKSLIIKMGAVFCIGAVIAFIITVFSSSVSHSRKLRKKQKMLESIRKKTVRKEGE